MIMRVCNLQKNDVINRMGTIYVVTHKDFKRVRLNPVILIKDEYFGVKGNSVDLGAKSLERVNLVGTRKRKSKSYNQIFKAA